MITLTGEYSGHKKCVIVHEQGAKIQTDAPKDNGGEGSLFSPTDLVAAALGSCVLTVMGLFAERHAIDLAGAKMKVTKEMTNIPVRRINRLVVIITLPAANIPESMREKLEKVGHSCPVHHSLHPDIDTTIQFIYE